MTITDLSTVVVQGHFLNLLTGDPSVGQVRFTMSGRLVNQATGQIITPEDFTAVLDTDGRFSLTLPCTDDADFLPADRFWTVTEFIDGHTRTYAIDLPASPPTQDLADIAPLDPTQPNIVYQLAGFGQITDGPKGDITVSGSGTVWTVTAGGSGISALTGDVTASGTGSVAATIANDAVTNAKAANMAQATLKGRAAAAGTGDPTDLTPTQAKTLLAIANTDVSGLGTLSTQNGTFSGTSSGTNTGDQTVTLTGDITGTGTGSFATTLKNTGPGATGPLGSATVAPIVTIDAQGRVTALSSATIAIPESAVTNLTTDLAAKAPLASPTFTGAPNGPTWKSTGNTGANTTPVTLTGSNASGSPASGAHVKGEVAGDDTGKLWYCTVAGTPGTWVNVGGSATVADGDYGDIVISSGVWSFDTSVVTAAAKTVLDDTTVGAMLTTMGGAPLASPTFTGTPAAPTASQGTNTTQVATTAMVHSEVVLLAPLASPALTGHPTGVTEAAGNNSTRLASTAYADALVSDTAYNAGTWDAVTGIAPSKNAVRDQVVLLATLASPTFTGTPAAPTAAQGTNTTQLATTAMVHSEAVLLAPLASPTFTGTPAAPTASQGTNTTQVATTAMVHSEVALLTPLTKATAVKTSAYAAAAWDEVPVDTTSGTFATTLPTAPADGVTIIVKWVAPSTSANPPTVVTGGSDVFNVSGGSTTATFVAVNQVLTFRYKATGAIWYVETSFSKGGLDTLYKPASILVSLTSSATPTIAVGTAGADVHVSITALATAITSMTTNLSGTPTDFQKMIVRTKDDGTARAITWGASFASKGATLPTTTVISKLLTVAFLYNTATSLWGCVSVALEA